MDYYALTRNNVQLKAVPGYVAPVIKKVENASHPLAGISGI